MFPFFERCNWLTENGASRVLENFAPSDKQTDLDFWKERLRESDLNGELKYGNLRKVVGCMLSLPFANAPVERLFSSLKLIKTEHRNSLKRESLCGLLHSKEGLAVVGRLLIN